MPHKEKRMVQKMANLWWKKKNEPAEEFDNAYYGNDSVSQNDSGVENEYGSYDNGDAADIGVAWSEEEAKAIAKANEPLKKKTFSPKTCQDSTAIVDAYKDGRVIVICVEELDRENFLRLFDYVMGAVHALDGVLRRLDRDTVLLIPYGVEEEVSVDELEEAEDETAASDETDGEEEN